MSHNQHKPFSDTKIPVGAVVCSSCEHEETIKYLRGALKMIQEDASRPFDKTRQQMCKVLAERAIEKTKQYDGK